MSCERPDRQIFCVCVCVRSSVLDSSFTEYGPRMNKAQKIKK